MPMKVRYTVIDGEVISENRAGIERDYVPDPLGSTVALLNSSQTITDTFSYWPYGESKSRTGSTATPFQYVGTLGYYQDSSTRNYVRARHLRKDLTRWLTEDPIGLDGGDWNKYVYRSNNPIAYVDPTGKAGVCCTIHCYLNHLGTNPICNARDVPFIGRGCAASEKEAYQLASDQADDALRRWNAKRGSDCQFKHCDNDGCTSDRGQRGRRKATGGVPAPVRWLANCSDAQLKGLCIITAAGIVICLSPLVPVIIIGRKRIPAALGLDKSD